MNHGPAFQTLWTQLRNEVHALQSRGYYGDGPSTSLPKRRASAHICHCARLLVLRHAPRRPRARRRRRPRAGRAPRVPRTPLPPLFHPFQPLPKPHQCGGAHSRTRPTRRRRRPQKQSGPSTSTGAQTAKRRKPGARVTRKDAFGGAGVALNDGASADGPKAKGTGFGKQAGSKRAREERAEAVERRLAALAGKGARLDHPLICSH
jgi:hypothetical protein